MKLINLKKYGILKRLMGIDPIEEEGNYYIDQGHRTMYVGVSDVVEYDDGLHLIVPTLEPKPQGNAMIFMEVNPDVLKYGGVSYPHLLTKAEDIKILFSPKSDGDLERVSELQWLAKFKVTEQS